MEMNYKEQVLLKCFDIIDPDFFKEFGLSKQVRRALQEYIQILEPLLDIKFGSFNSNRLSAPFNQELEDYGYKVYHNLDYYKKQLELISIDFKEPVISILVYIKKRWMLEKKPTFTAAYCGQPVFCEVSEQYFADYDELTDHFYYLFSGNPDVDFDTYSYFYKSCKTVSWNGLNIIGIMENVMETYFNWGDEDHSDKIVDLDELYKFVENWNKKQSKVISYYPNRENFYIDCTEVAREVFKQVRGTSHDDT